MIHDFRCGTKLRDPDFYEKLGEPILDLDLDRIFIQNREEDRYLHCLLDRSAYRFHRLLVTLPQWTQPSDLQDEVDAHDHTARGIDQDQKCREGATVSELYHYDTEEVKYKSVKQRRKRV